MKSLSTFLFCSALMASALHAEIEKIAIPGDTGMKLYWWPKLATVAGWHHERGASLRYSSNALVPDGFTFSNSDTVIYGRAIYKPREPDVKSLATLIENDRRDFVANSPGIEISEVEALATSDGKKFRSFTFSPKASGSWERVTYGEEGEFYLIFTVSSRTKKGLKGAIATYQTLISLYKEEANQPAQTTPTAVTTAAAQPARQP